ncbi:MAG: mechanosensitive ion channel family protein [Ktedonobacterales bacterium]
MPGQNLLIQQLTTNPVQVGVQLALTVGVLLAALLITPSLARWAARAPTVAGRRRASRGGIGKADVTHTANGSATGTTGTTGPNGAHVTTGAFVVERAADGHDRRQTEGAIHMAADEVDDTEEPHRLGPWLAWLMRLCIWITALAAIAVIWLYGQDNAFNGKLLLHQFVTFAIQLGISLAVLAATLVLARVAQRAIVGSLHRSRLNRNLILLSGRLIYITVLVIGIIVILAVWGTGLVLPVTLVGVLTVALSLALQDILRNLVSGVYLLLERPFVIGDYITITPYSGEVEDIQLRVTSLRTLDGERVLIPNAMLFTSAVVNLSAFQRRRVALQVALPASGPDTVDLDAAEARILAALDAAPSILSDPAPLVTVSRATPDKIELRVIFWTPTERLGTAGAGDVLSRVIEELRGGLPEADVSAPGASTPAPAPA